MNLTIVGFFMGSKSRTTRTIIIASDRFAKNLSTVYSCNIAKNLKYYLLEFLHVLKEQVRRELKRSRTGFSFRCF